MNFRKGLVLLIITLVPAVSTGTADSSTPLGKVNLKIDETKLRKELSDQLEKAISTKDEAAFEKCFGFEDLKPEVKDNVKSIEKKIFEWEKAYVEAVDPILYNRLNPKELSSGNTVLTFEKDSKELNGKYLFDLHICKEKPPKRGYMLVLGGGVHNGKPIVLTTTP